MIGVNSCWQAINISDRRAYHAGCITYRQIIEAEFIKHVLVMTLQGAEVDVLFDTLVLRAELRKASGDMNVVIEHRRSQSLCGFGGGWSGAHA